MKRYVQTTMFVIALTLPTAAFAYVGPGAGLSLLGALWALIAAIGTALAFVIAWPVRQLLRRRSGGGHARDGSKRGRADDRSAH